MKAYKISVDDDPIEWHGVFKDAHENAKGRMKTFNKEHWGAIRIEECEVPTDKNNIIALLNESGWECETLRTWAFTPRGGTKQVKNGE